MEVGKNEECEGKLTSDTLGPSLSERARTRGSDDPGIQLPRDPSISEDSKRNLKSHPPPILSRGMLDLTRNWLSIILALLWGRDTY